MRVDTGRLRVVAHDLSEAEDLSSYQEEDDAPELIPTRDDDLPSPGAYIEAQRVRRGMSIEQLAVVTKIPARSLALLEADRFDELPGQVFVKGFLRCCARALGVSQPAVMDLLYERERALLQARRKERVEPSEDRAPRPSSKPSKAAKPAAKAKPSRTSQPGQPGRPSKTAKASKPARSSQPSQPSQPSKPRAAKSGPVEAPVGLPPKLTKGTRPSVTAPSPVERLRELVPSAHALLWIVVAIFVAFLVLAAFNLAGSPVGAPGT